MSDSGFTTKPDIPRMTGQNYIMLDVSDGSGPTLLSYPEFYCHTTIDSVGEIVYSGSPYGVVIKSYVKKGIVSLTVEATDRYKPTDGVHTDSCTISLTSTGSKSSWSPGTGKHKIIVVLNGTGTSLPMPLYKHVEQIKVSPFREPLLYNNTWSAVSPSTPADKFATKTLYYNNQEEPYFTLTDPDDSDSLWDDYLFEGIPKSPESLVAVAYHKTKGLSVVPVVITDTRKYTSQENGICVIQSNNNPQAIMHPEKARLIDIDSSDSNNWFNRHIGNGDVLVLGSSNNSEGYKCIQAGGSPPSYSKCPYKNTSTGECTSRYGCTYNYNKNVSITKSNWAIWRKSDIVSKASGITNYDKNPPCSGWSNGAVVNCDPSFIFSDDAGTSMYEYKGSLELTRFYKDENGMCAEYMSEHLYYQKRPIYSKKFHNWPTYGNQGYGEDNSPEASADIITKNESDVYNVGFIMAPLNPTMDVADKVNKTFGVGLMCGPPSHNHLDMAIAAGNSSGYMGCASTIGGTYCMPLEYGGYTNGAPLQAYSPLTRYMTPFESTPLEGTASISIDKPRITICRKKVCMSYFYSCNGRQDGALIVRNKYGSEYVYCIGIPIGRGSDSHKRIEYYKNVKIIVDVGTDNSTKDISNIPLNLYKSTAKNDPNAYPDCMFGYATGTVPSGGIIYHIKTYNIEKNTQDIPDYYIDTDTECIGSGSGGGGAPGTVAIPLKEGTQVKVVISYTVNDYWYGDCQDLKVTVNSTHTWTYSSGRWVQSSYTTNISGAFKHYQGDQWADSMLSYIDTDDKLHIKAEYTITPTQSTINNCGGFGGLSLISPDFTMGSYTKYTEKGITYYRIPSKSSDCGDYGTGTCTISIVDGCSDKCIHTIKYNGNAPTYITRRFNISEGSHTIQKFKSSDTLCMSAVYPFEGPDISAARYRSIMSAHSTSIIGGSTTYEKPVSEIKLKGSQTVDMGVGSYADRVGSVDVEDATYISDKPVSVPIATDNNYKFSLSYEYDDSSSSSGDNDSITWYPDKAFVVLYEYSTISQSKTIAKGSTEIPYLDNVGITGTRSFKAYVLDFSTVYSSPFQNGISMADAVEEAETEEADGDKDAWKNLGSRYIKYITVSFSEKMPLPSESKDPDIDDEALTLDDALKKIDELTDEYERAAGVIASGNMSCPTYTSKGVSRTVLCTYMDTPPSTEEGLDGWETALKGWAVGGIPDHFYTQLDSNLKYNTNNGSMSDILSAGITDTPYYNSKFVVTMYGGGSE